MKQIIGKQKKKSSQLLKKSKESQKKKAKLQENSLALASKVPIITKDISEYLPQCNASMEHKELSFQEFEKVFKTLKRIKAIGCHGLNGNIIMDVYDSIKVTLFKIFKAFLEEAVLPERLKNNKSYSSF